ncbi:hypothetical protein JW930_06195 [Candidatus Woesearchaeota archaeon]|nr:hypothetical protein [Candidatus Woesearchaeota archaeon]
MFIFGINLPLPEILFLLALVYTFAIVYFAVHLKKLEKMTQEETKELEELEKIAQEEKSDIEAMMDTEKKEEMDITKFEKDIGELEEDTETLYLKKLVPDVYKLQNYVLWALKKGITPETIKQNLYSKGWKDKDLIDMVVADMSRYVKYYRDRKGHVELPEVKITAGSVKILEPRKFEPQPIKEKKPKKKKSTTKKKAKKESKLKKEEISVEEEIQKLENELKTKKPNAVKSKKKKASKKKPKKKKAAAKKPITKKTTKKSTRKTASKSAAAKKPGKKTKKSTTKKLGKKEQKSQPTGKPGEKPKSVISVEGKKDFDIDIKIK